MHFVSQTILPHGVFPEKQEGRDHQDALEDGGADEGDHVPRPDAADDDAVRPEDEEGDGGGEERGDEVLQVVQPLHRRETVDPGDNVDAHKKV